MYKGGGGRPELSSEYKTHWIPEISASKRKKETRVTAKDY